MDKIFCFFGKNTHRFAKNLSGIEEHRDFGLCFHLPSIF